MNSIEQPKRPFWKRILRFTFSKEMGIAIVGAVLGIGATYINSKIEENSKSKEFEYLYETLKTQNGQVNNQTATLKEGFNTLSKSLTQQSNVDPAILKIIESLAMNVDKLATTTSVITKNSNDVINLAEYFHQKDNIPSGANEVWVSAKDGNAEYIDAENQVAVTKWDSSSNQALVNLNANSGWWNPGDKRAFNSKNKRKCTITFMGKRGEFFIFSTTCE